MHHRHIIWLLVSEAHLGLDEVTVGEDLRLFAAAPLRARLAASENAWLPEAAWPDWTGESNDLALAEGMFAPLADSVERAARASGDSEVKDNRWRSVLPSAAMTDDRKRETIEGKGGVNTDSPRVGAERPQTRARVCG